MAYLDRIKARLDELHFIPPKGLKPCTEEEVVRLEQARSVKLPQAYREFLLWMGSSGGSLFIGSDCFYRDLPLIQKGAVELLEEDQFPLKLPEDAFVFYMHQGYNFDFFRPSEGDDPPVYYYLEDSEQTSFTEVFSHYSDALLAWIENEAKVTASLAESWKQGRRPAVPEIQRSVEYYLEGLQLREQDRRNRDE